MIDAYPLCWPSEYPRTKTVRDSRFKTTLAAARDYVKAEIKRLDGKGLIISTNIPLKDNGDLRADWTRFKLDDHGAAVYFTRNNQQVVLCCDTYSRVWENLHAIGRTVEALRQIDRDGVSDFLNRSFTGFKLLPEKIETESWSKTLQVEPWASEAEIKAAYLHWAKIFHPDKMNGSSEDFNRIRKAYTDGIAHLKKSF